MIQFTSLLLLPWLLAFFLISTTPNAIAEGNKNSATVLIQPETKHLNINNNAQYFIDQNNNKSFAWIHKQDVDTLFKPGNLQTTNLGYSEASIWAYFRIINDTNENDLYLEIGHPLINTIEVRVLKDGELVQSKVTGIDYPFSHREIQHPNFTIPLELEKNQIYSIYIRAKATHSTNLPLSVHTRLGFVERTFSSGAITFSFFGLMLGVFFYNLFLFAFIKSKAYLYYLFYLSFVILHQSAVMGVGIQYFWPNHVGFSVYSPVIFACLLFIAASEFSLTFLRINNYSKVLSRGFRAIQLACLFILILLPFTNVIITSKMGMIIIVFTLTWIIASAIYALKKGLIVARYFLLGWSILALSIIIYISYLNNLFPLSSFSYYSFQIGTSLEAIILSIALADKINVMRKEKYALQKKSVDSLQASNKLKDDFLSTISHELRTPINGIQGALQLMSMESPTDRAKEYIGMAHISSQNMLMMIENILLFSELQSGNLKIRSDAINITSMLHDLEETFKPACTDKNIEFSITYDPAIKGRWLTDADLLKKLLTIFIENAIKFTHRGFIHLKTEIHAESSNTFIKFSIKDSGIGIHKDNLNQIFDSFSQLDSSFSRQYSGLGIGLAIAKKIIMLMKGNLNVSSQPKGGSLFYFSIPFVQHTQALLPGGNDSNHTPLKSIDHKNHCVLVVEDNKVNQSIIVAMLKKLHYTAFTADNGAIALDIVKKGKIDLILMDCQMPVMDGFTATQAIRALAAPTKMIPIIAVTANATTQDMDHCLASGMTDYLKKPITLAQLKEKIELYLNE